MSVSPRTAADSAPDPAALAVLLAALAGYVDAIAWQSLGGFFASFMSGNATRLALGLAQGQAGAAMLGGALLLAFLAGVVGGVTLGEAAGRWRAAAAMALATFFLALAAWAPLPHPIGPLLLAVAMGAENAVRRREGGGGLGLTYITGTLAELGDRLAGALMGRTRPWTWMSPALMLGGFIAGAVLGGVKFLTDPLGALNVAVGAGTALTLLLAAMAANTRPRATVVRPARQDGNPGVR